ncbi:MAG TPA: hypothetical protein VJ810_29050 [Blastocatellia bacterium]|nr:hypothetical protein [Blastocatellia bacterium]
MAKDPVHRVRAITVTFPYIIHSLFGLQPAAFYSASIILNILNCWLLFAAGRWSVIGYEVSFWAAAFFAVYEGHAEAVMWFSGVSELLMFFFGLLSFLCWLIFLEKETARLRWLASSILFFLPALLSKESAVIFIALFALPLLFPKARLRQSLYLLPHISISVVYVAVVFMALSHSFRFQDQSFVLSAPFWLTWTKSYGAMLWFWGLTATISIVLWSRSDRNQRDAETMKINHEETKGAKKIEDRGSRIEDRGSTIGPSLEGRSSILDLRSSIFISFLWIGIGFIPYMFVDYMHRIPSRQIYLASAGLAWLMGVAIVMMKERYWKNHKRIVTVVLLIILLHNVVYMWTKKREHFLGRAEPTEQLLSLARSVNGPIFVKCFPLAQIHAEAALELILNKPASDLIWKEEEAAKRPPAATFCYK